MAPEYPPSLVIVDSRIEDAELKGTTEYVESARFDHPFRVRWNAESQPKNYRAFGGGVAYVYDAEAELRGVPLSEDVSAIPLGDNRYLWTEGLQSGCPSMMFILILPLGFSISDPYPRPVGSKIFLGRLALYWILRSTEQERVGVEWTLARVQTDIKSERIAINKKYLASRMKAPSNIEVEDIQRADVALSLDSAASHAFVAMPMDADDHALVDVLDAIKEGAKRCGVRAERVDEETSNDRITDRMLESIKSSEYVIVDLTYSRPNVFFEAGFAHGQGKIPVYVARHGTKLEFDLKDYPVLFFRNMKELRDSIEKRLGGLIGKTR